MLEVLADLPVAGSTLEVESDVVAVRQQFEVFESVVELVAVAVVDMMARWDRSIGVLPDHAVFVHLNAVPADHSVADSVDGATSGRSTTSNRWVAVLFPAAIVG